MSSTQDKSGGRSPLDIVVFSGAGLSAAAGLRTYRGPGGLWSDSEIVKASHASGLRTNPELCWAHWGGLRKQIDESGPTSSHRALAAAQLGLPEGASLHIVTQNVDGLHGAALRELGGAEARDDGKRSIIEFHGNVFMTRCTNDKCDLAPYEDHEPHLDSLPHCPRCGSLLRPGVTLFGEAIDQSPQTNKVQEARRIFKRAGTVIVVGTTLEVQPASKVVDIKKRFFSGVDTVWINVERPPAQLAFAFRRRYQSPADDTLPELVARLLGTGFGPT